MKVDNIYNEILYLRGLNDIFRRVWEGDSLLTELFRDRFYAIIYRAKGGGDHDHSSNAKNRK